MQAEHNSKADNSGLKANSEGESQTNGETEELASPPPRYTSRQPDLRHASPGQIQDIQRRFGNRAVSRALSSQIQRALDHAAVNVNDRVVDVTSFELYDVTAKQQVNKPLNPGILVWRFTLTKVDSAQTRNVYDYTSNNLYLHNAPQVAQARRNAELQSLGGFTSMVWPMADYSFEGWFNYLWKEVVRSSLVDVPTKRRWYDWAVALRDNPNVAPPLGGPPDFSDASKRLVLDEMLSSAVFAPFNETAMVPISKALEASQSGAYPRELPDLVDTGLVYRSDSRDPATINQHGGSRPRTRMDNLSMEMNLHKAWNPFQDERKRRSLYLRLGASSDNDLNTVVSIAVDPRDAVKFPLPVDNPVGPAIAPNQDTANLYVIWSGQALDTSRLVKEKTGQDVFGRGELGAAHVPAEAHLVHIQTERHYKLGSTSYVAGRILNVNVLQPEEVIMNLPRSTRRGLFQVLRALNADAGNLQGWLVHGSPDAGSLRHGAIQAQVTGGGVAAFHSDPLTQQIGQLETASNNQPLFIDYPSEREIIRSNSYTLRIFGQPAINNVHVQVDNGEFVQTRQGQDGSQVYYWLDVDTTKLQTGQHTFRAKGWNAAGDTFQAPERHVMVDTSTTLEPIINFPKIGEIINWPSYMVEIETDTSIKDVHLETANGLLEKKTPVREPTRILWKIEWSGYGEGEHWLRGRAIKEDGGQKPLGDRFVRYRAGLLSPSQNQRISLASLQAGQFTLRLETGTGVTINTVTASVGNIGVQTLVDGELRYPWTGLAVGAQTITVQGTHGGNAFTITRNVIVVN